MSRRVTKKWVKQVYGSPCLIPVNVNMEHLLIYKSPDFYNTRVEGWACDLYYFVGYDVVLSVGDASWGYKLDNYDFIIERDRKAKDILNNMELTEDQKKEKIDILLDEIFNLIKY